MDFRSIFKMLSMIGATLALFFSMELFSGIYYAEEWGKLAIFLSLFLLLNLFVWYILREHRINLKIKESILAVNLLWLLLGAVGAIPLLLYTDISFSSAFFEAISGFTTTGATVYGDIEALPHLILLHRSLMHWLGGMGVIVLGVGLLSMINPTGSLSLFKAEATGIELEKLTPKIKDTATRLWEYDYSHDYGHYGGDYAKNHFKKQAQSEYATHLSRTRGKRRGIDRDR